MGTDDASHKSGIHSRWFLRGRRCSFVNTRLFGGLGNGYRWINPHPESHERALGLET